MKIVNLCITTPNNERILLINRKKEPYQGYWAMPGGKNEKGESYELAAIRELKEETGIIRKLQEPIGFCIEEIKENGQLKYSFEIAFFQFFSEQIKIGNCAEGNFEWFNLTDLEKMRVIPSDIMMLDAFCNKRANYTESFVEKVKQDYTQRNFFSIGGRT